MVAFGAADGPKARAIRDRMIDAAGRDSLTALYRERLQRTGARA